MTASHSPQRTRHPLRQLAAIASSLAAAMLLAPGSAAANSTAADRVLTDGSIYTVDRDRPWARALAIDGGRIVYVGGSDGARRYIGPKTKVTDLDDRMVMPGLEDGHTHPSAAGEVLSSCSLDYEPLTVADFQQRIQACLDATSDKEPDGWLEVSAWFAEETQPPGTVITKSALDALDTERPIVVYNADGHKSLTNSRGLELAGIDDDTPDPPGGVIDRDPSGEATGLLFETAQRLVASLVPDPTFAEELDYARIAIAEMTRNGITSGMDAAGGADALRVFDALRRKGELDVRLAVASVLDAAAADELPSTLRRLRRLRDRYHSPRLWTDTVKIFGDGVLEYPAQTAALLEPYLVEEGGSWVPGPSSGELQVAPDAMRKIVKAVDRRGWQVHVHAIGDAAVREALDAFQAARRANDVSGWGNRDTITHLQLVHPDDYARFERLRVIADMQMQWFQRDGYSVDAVESFIGPERFARMYPAGSLLDAGAKVSGASDWPVDPLAPFSSLERAVTRTADPWSGYPDAPLNADEAISLRDAVRAYTINSAFQLGQERTNGSLEKGKQADLIVLDRNLFEVPIDDVGDTNVELTMVGGDVVYERDG